jgi:hypothetical protein
VLASYVRFDSAGRSFCSAEVPGVCSGSRCQRSWKFGGGWRHGRGKGVELGTEVVMSVVVITCTRTYLEVLMCPTFWRSPGGELSSGEMRRLKADSSIDQLIPAFTDRLNGALSMHHHAM